MYLYNVTVGIDQADEARWLAWMKGSHMQHVLNTGMFVSAKIYKVLHDNEDGTLSYSVQYLAESLENVVQYLEQFAPALIEEHKQQFKHVAFRTLLEEV
ncbi:DUF4286 family protein [Oscillatoria amoena NRMC-F 0135]|nr:DUF4286 family protein [Oscillatoria amoena NRMC-F 0135]